MKTMGVSAVAVVETSVEGVEEKARKFPARKNSRIENINCDLGDRRLL